MIPARSRTIPPVLHGPLMAFLREAGPDGKTHTIRDAAVWLADEHGIKTSPRAIARVTAIYNHQAKDLYASILRDEIRDAVGPALDRLRAASRRLGQALEGEEDVKSIALATRAQVAVFDSLAKVSGVAAAEVTLKGSPDGLAAFLATAFRQGDGAPPAVGE